MFVFETANRIVVEKPQRWHATYFFEIEEPLPIPCQALDQFFHIVSSAKHLAFISATLGVHSQERLIGMHSFFSRMHHAGRNIGTRGDIPSASSQHSKPSP